MSPEASKRPVKVRSKLSQNTLTSMLAGAAGSPLGETWVFLARSSPACMHIRAQGVGRGGFAWAAAVVGVGRLVSRAASCQGGPPRNPPPGLSGRAPKAPALRWCAHNAGWSCQKNRRGRLPEPGDPENPPC